VALESELVEVGVMFVMVGAVQIEYCKADLRSDGRYQYIRNLALRVNVTLAEVSRIGYSISPTVLWLIQ